MSDIPPSVSDLHAFPLDRLSSPLPSSSLLFRNVVWSGSKPDGGATISRPQKRLRINVPLLLPSLLRPRPITLDSPPPGADYNYRAFCFAIRRGSSPPPRIGASKIPLIFQPAPLCVESSEKTPHLTSFIIVNHRPEMIGGIYFIFRVIIVKKNVTRIVALLTSIIIIKKSIETNNLFCQFYFYVINRIFLVTRYFRTGGYSYRTEKEIRKKKKKTRRKLQRSRVGQLAKNRNQKKFSWWRDENAARIQRVRLSGEER